MGYTMAGLKSCFNTAKEEEFYYVGVKIQMQGFDEPEVIINPYDNFDAKLAYYKKAYNDDLTLKSFSGIKIIDFCFADSYIDIQADLCP